VKKSINIKTTYFRAAILLLLGLAWFSSCSKQDTNPQLEIKVVNLDGQPVPDVKVGLFDELDEWSMLENPVQVWRLRAY